MDHERPILRGGEHLAHPAEKVRGGADKYHPQDFAAARRHLQPMAHALREAAVALPEGLRGERIVIEAKMLPNYLAASHHPTQLRRLADLVVVGTRAATGTLRTRTTTTEDQPTKTLLLAATIDSLAQLEAVVTAEPETVNDRVKLDVAKFEELALPGPTRLIRRRRDDPVEPDPDEVITWEAVLHPAVDRRGRLTDEAQRLVLARWHAHVERLHGEVHDNFIRGVGNLTFMPVTLRRRELEEAGKFNGLRAMRPMPRMRRIPVERIRRVETAAAPEPPEELPPAGHRIAIFDGGVDANSPLLAPFVTTTDLTSSPADADALAHGTLVTSAALFGHIQVGRRLETPPAHIDHYRILPAPPGVDPDDEPYWVADRMEETIRAGTTRLVVLSYGPDAPVDEDLEPDRFTTMLDHLGYVEDVSFVVAAGNNGEPNPSPLGHDRVMAPSDGVNVVSVGAADRPAPHPCMRAEYSAIGPGRPGLRVSPLGLSFGGSNDEEFTGLAVGGGLVTAQGTSFAAPSAARGLATLMSPLGPAFGVNTARAFAAHFAAELDCDRLVEQGHGRLADSYEPYLGCEEHEITVLVLDTLSRGETKGYPFPIPAGGLQGMIELRWTVSFASPIDEEDPVEYTLAGLDIDFRPNRAKMTLSPPRGHRANPREIDLRKPPADLGQLTAAGWSLSANPKTRSGKAIRSELTQREEGKWETVVRHDDRPQARTLFDPEVWLTYYERAQGQLVAPEVASDLDFAMLMTIKANKVANLYADVVADQRYAVLQPLVVPAAGIRVS